MTPSYYEIRVVGVLPPEALLDFERLTADVAADGAGEQPKQRHRRADRDRGVMADAPPSRAAPSEAGTPALYVNCPHPCAPG
ncbi:MAG TPA: hypothetical protein VMV92_33955 [Streptosporangiaceae bacterium]|nr:hypothetical protein [Streptosporangiaceae bacterium]